MQNYTFSPTNSHSQNFSTFNSQNSMQQQNSKVNNYNLRRRSLGNIGSPYSYSNTDLDLNQFSSPFSYVNKNKIHPSSSTGFLNDDLMLENSNIEQKQMSTLYADTHVSENADKNEYLNFLASQHIIQQQQMQLQQQQQQLEIQRKNQENLSNFMRLCNNSGLDFGEPNTSPQNQSLINNFSNMDTLQGSPINNKQNFRRRSICPIISSPLKPVYESRSSSPTFSYPLPQPVTPQSLPNPLIQQQQLEQKLNLLSANFNFQSGGSNQNPILSRQISSPLSSSSSNLNNNAMKTRLRAGSIGSISSYDINNSINISQQNANSLSASLSSIYSLQNNSANLTNSKSFANSFEEKLAITGNMFQRREDWSIIYKLPLNKQNTIHIRLEDEGPYGNDEIRCFVLSHFSSLAIKNLSCAYCSCDLVIYDRFPLVDGTLFVSPYAYDKKKSVPAIVSTKPQFIYAICLKCMNSEQDHEIKCTFCDKSWQLNGGDSLQIGTLYKYDIFAAFPCCQKRLSCKNCEKPIMDTDQIGEQPFSMFSEEKECPYCKAKGLHFIKPLEDIFKKPKCASIMEKSPHD